MLIACRVAWLLHYGIKILILGARMKKRARETGKDIAIYIVYYGAIFVVLSLLVTCVNTCAGAGSGSGGSGAPWDGHDPTQYGPW